MYKKTLLVQKDFLRSDVEYKDKYVYPLISVSNVKENYVINQSWTLSFDVYDDGSDAFKALSEQCIIWLDAEPFAVQSITYKHAGRTTVSINANHFINSEFKRIVQPKQLYYKDTDDSDDENGSGSSATNKFYCDLKYLLNWFFDGVDTHNIDYVPGRDIQGHFPVRPLKGISPTDQKVDGQKLLSAIKSTWPGTRILPKRFHVVFQGYGPNRDKNGNPINIGNIRTGRRFDTLGNLTSSEETFDRSSMCNAVEVKFATHKIHQQIKSSNSDDDDDQKQTNNWVFNEVPYHSPLLVTSKSSTDKYGVFLKTSVLDDGFTNVNAAISAAREGMVVEPTLQVKATVNTPGKTEDRPVPGSLYTYAVQQQNKIYQDLMLMGFTRYPLDSKSGMEIQLSKVTPTITEHITSVIINDMTTNPQLTDFQKTDPPKTQDLEAPEIEDSDETDDRPDDDGDGTDDTTNDKDKDKDKKGKKGKNDGVGDTYDPADQYMHSLPVYDKTGDDDLLDHKDSPGPQAFFETDGSLLTNRNNPYVYLRQGGSDQIDYLIHSGWGTIEKQEEGDTTVSGDNGYDHVLGVEIGKYGIDSINTRHGHHHENGENHDFWKPASLTIGGTMISSTGLIVTQGNQIVFRSHAAQQDLDNKGFYKRNTKKNRDGVTYTDDVTPSGWLNDKDLDNVNWQHVNNPGVLATLHFHQAGSVNHPIKAVFSRFLGSNNRWVNSSWIKTINVKNVNKSSVLSEKENVKPLDPLHALLTTLGAKIFNYNYKHDDEKHASIVINDIDDKNTHAPKDWITKNGNGKARKDDVTVGYLVASFQALYKLITNKNKKQDEEIRDLKAEIKELKKLLSQKQD